MNGRIYDPRLGRFLSPDPYVQAPYNSQNYNRYSYCLNNPLKYTDPDGESFIVAAAIIIGAAIGAHTGYKIAKSKGYDWNDGKMWGYIIGGGVIGGVAGWCGASVATSVMASSLAAGAGTIEASAVAGGMSGLVGGAINGGGMALISGGDAIDVIGGIMQGGCIGAFSGAAAGAAGAGINQLADKLSETVEAFKTARNWLPLNTISYAGSSVASKSVSNAVQGRNPFDISYKDIFNVGIIIPAAIDMTTMVAPSIIKSYLNNNLLKDTNRSIKTAKARTSIDNKGNMNIEAYAEIETAAHYEWKLHNSRPFRRYEFIDTKVSVMGMEGCLIENYNSLIYSLIYRYK